MRKLQLIFFCLILSICTLAINRNLSDSLQQILEKAPESEKLKIYNQLAYIMADQKPDLALNYALEALDLAKTRGDSTAINNSLKNLQIIYTNIIKAYEYLKNYSRMAEYLKDLINVNKQLNNEAGMADNLIKLGNIYYIWLNYESSLGYYKTAFSAYQSDQDKLGMADVSLKIASVYHDWELYKISLEHFQNSLSIFQSLNDSSGMAATHLNIGKVHAALENFGVSEEFFNKSMEISKKIKDTAKIAVCCDEMGVLYTIQKKKQLAMQKFSIAEKLFLQLKDKYGFAKVLYHKGLFYKEGNPDIARQIFKKSYNIAHEIENLKLQMDNSLELMQIEYGSKNYKLAFDYSQKYHGARESYRKEITIKQLSEMKAKYQASQKEKAIERLQVEKEKQIRAIYSRDIKLKKQRLVLILGTISLLAVGIFIFLIYRRNKIIRDINAKLNIKNQQISNQKEILVNQSESLQKANNELQKLSIVASETDNAVLIADKYGNIEWVNKAFTEIFEYTLEEYISEKGANILDSSTNSSQIVECIKNKKSFTYTSFTISKNGRKIWLKTEITPVLNKNGELEQLVVVDSDVTIFKDAESEIQLQKEEMENQRDVAIIQKEKIFSQNKNIKDSIQYAFKIQSALLPSKAFLHKILGDHFVLNMPRDIVSGDYYWVKEKNNLKYIVVADSTGHGVPGAFMSILGITLLNELVQTKGYKSAADFLNNLRENVVTAISENSNDKNTTDGFDLGLCILNKQNKTIDFAGANLSLYVSKPTDLEVLKGDRMPVGIHPLGNRPFTSRFIELKKGDKLYMTSDGYVDQFGWRDGKKLKPARFKQFLRELFEIPIEGHGFALENNLSIWKGETEQVDDILVLGFEIS